MATFLTYAGDALWIIALTIMFSASRSAAGETQGREKLPFLGGQAPRVIALWMLPVATFAVSLWLVLRARGAEGDMAVIVFGVRATLAAMLALLHLRWLAQALKP